MIALPCLGTFAACSYQMELVSLIAGVTFLISYQAVYDPELLYCTCNALDHGCNKCPHVDHDE